MSKMTKATTGRKPAKKTSTAATVATRPAVAGLPQGAAWAAMTPAERMEAVSANLRAEGQHEPAETAAAIAADLRGEKTAPPTRAKVEPYTLQRSETQRLEALRLLARAWRVEDKGSPVVETRLPWRGVGEVLVENGPAARCTFDEWNRTLLAAHPDASAPATDRPELADAAWLALARAATSEPWAASTVADFIGDALVQADGFAIALNRTDDTLLVIEQVGEDTVRVRPIGRWLASVGVLPSQTAPDPTIGDACPAYLDETAAVEGAA